MRGKGSDGVGGGENMKSCQNYSSEGITLKGHNDKKYIRMETYQYMQYGSQISIGQTGAKRAQENGAGDLTGACSLFKRLSLSLSEGRERKKEKGRA